MTVRACLPRPMGRAPSPSSPYARALRACCGFECGECACLPAGRAAARQGGARCSVANCRMQAHATRVQRPPFTLRLPRTLVGPCTQVDSCTFKNGGYALSASARSKLAIAKCTFSNNTGVGSEPCRAPTACSLPPAANTPQALTDIESIGPTAAHLQALLQRSRPVETPRWGGAVRSCLHPAAARSAPLPCCLAYRRAQLGAAPRGSGLRGPLRAYALP